jgi:MraZ protein
VQRFRSHSEHTLDPKGRLNIPSRFRDVLRDQYNSEMLIVTHWDKNLRAYPLAEWEALEEKLLAQEGGEPDFDELVRYIIAGVNECPVDKQGRILLPPALRSEMGIDKDVAVVGMLRHFEIWDKHVWDEESNKIRQNFANYRAGLAKLGIM